MAAANAVSGMAANAAANAAAQNMLGAAMGKATNPKTGKTTAPPALPAATGTPAAATGPAAAAALWVNYDFVPGERVIFYSDYSTDQVGNFPDRLEFVEGNMEVAELGGRRMIRATSASKLNIQLPETLPQRFTIEIDVITGRRSTAPTFTSGEASDALTMQKLHSSTGAVTALRSWAVAAAK